MMGNIIFKKILKINLKIVKKFTKNYFKKNHCK